MRLLTAIKKLVRRLLNNESVVREPTEEHWLTQEQRTHLDELKEDRRLRKLPPKH